jgi:hypothetical protein
MRVPSLQSLCVRKVLGSGDALPTCVQEREDYINRRATAIIARTWRRYASRTTVCTHGTTYTHKHNIPDGDIRYTCGCVEEWVAGVLVHDFKETCDDIDTCPVGIWTGCVCTHV